ncbi:SulP family inorganic anion transporter [Parachlamydia sp. AcF125]|uniref:SulP family inorganic anion transporter n=1 Tax=Parachlamydia sp. AcF125 TaxID=2795736 RepID=UPI001BC9ACC1|nr:SulP family inorganic anion transporter [Parachlamydia sp. AcF125]MBS4168030.1 putative sulfate transporter [Parachlamydia sp. AcF125]
MGSSIDRLSFFNSFQDLKNYSLSFLAQDISAGFSVALLSVPQAMAYAMVAGLPLSCGILAVIFSSLIAAALGSSRHLIVGPSNAIAIMVQAGTSQILFNYFRDLEGAEREWMAVQILTQLTLLVGLFQILVASLKLGRLTQFVSHSVVVGYAMGTAIAIIIDQFFIFLGIAPLGGVHAFYEKAWYLVSHLNQFHLPTLLISLGSLFLIVIFRRKDKRIPGAAIAFAFMGIVVQLMGLNTEDAESFVGGRLQHVLLIGNSGEVYTGLPDLAFPYFNTHIMSSVVPVAFAIALMSILESAAVAKSIAAITGQRLSLNQDIFAIGMGNFCGAFSGGAMPISGSNSRSMLNYISGAQTRFAAIFGAIFVATFLMAFGFFITRIPVGALAALLIVTAVSIVNRKQFLLCLKATNSDALVLWITILSCIFFSLDVAFYIGVVISITLYLKKAALPQLIEYGIDDSGKWCSAETATKNDKKKIRVIKVKGELFFGAADLFQSTLKSIAEDDTTTKVIILQLKHARDLDATGCLALHQLYNYLHSSGRHLILSGLTFPTWEVLSNSALIDLIGKENLFFLNERRPHLHMKKALRRAEALLCSASIPLEPESVDLTEKSYLEVRAD